MSEHESNAALNAALNIHVYKHLCKIVSNVYLYGVPLDTSIHPTIGLPFIWIILGKLQYFTNLN